MSAVLAPSLAFEPMVYADLERVAREEASIYEFPWTFGNFADSLAAGYSSWVASEKGAMIGYAVMMLVIDEAHLLNISVLPKLQRRGRGSEIMRHLFSVARSHGAHRMLLEVRPSNLPGRALYARHGFSPIGERRGYYPAREGRENAIVLARDI